MGRTPRLLRPIVLGGAMLFGAEAPAAQRPPEPPIRMEQVQSATQRELVRYLNSGLFAVRQEAYRLLVEQGTALIEKTRAPIDTSLLQPTQKGLSAEQRHRLRSIVEELKYAELQLAWYGSVFRPSDEEVATIASVGDLFEMLSRHTNNPISIQYVPDKAMLRSPCPNPESLRGKTFWEVFREIHDAEGQYVRINACKEGAAFVGRHLSRPLSASDGALYGRLDQRDQYADVHIALEPKLDFLHCQVRSVTGRRQDGSPVNMGSPVGTWFGRDKFVLDLPASERENDAIDVDITFELWALPMRTLVATDITKSASLRTGAIVADYIGISGPMNENEWYRISLSVGLMDGYPEQYGDRIGCMAFNGANESFPDRDEVWHQNPVQKNWYVKEKPIRIEFYIPDLLVLSAVKTLHFAGVKLPLREQKETLSDSCAFECEYNFP